MAALAVVAAGFGWHAFAPSAQAQANLLEKRESLYNNIFIFGDTNTVTMTFGEAIC